MTVLDVISPVIQTTLPFVKHCSVLINSLLEINKVILCKYIMFLKLIWVKNPIF